MQRVSAGRAGAYYRSLFYRWDHFCGVGNNGKIQERLRSLEGVLLLWGPEAKPILDPSFPVKESVDVGKYLDFTRWLECANGGKFEWGTGTEEKLAKGAKDKPPLLDFNPTNVHLCLLQQYTLFRKWSVKVERNHQCGFSAMGALLQNIWLRTAARFGPSVPVTAVLKPSHEAQKAVRAFYYAVHDLSLAGGWGSASRAALGKMEYHVPSAACLTAFHSLTGLDSSVLSDDAMKCGIRHFDLRVVHDCNVVDSEATAMHGEPAASRVPVSAVKPPRTPVSRLLLACVKDPITLSDVGNHITSLQGATQAEERIKLLQSLAAMQLGEVREGRRLPGADTRSVSFHRFPLSPTLRAMLQQLDVPESLWPVPPLSCPTDRLLPSMEGAGKRGRRAAAEENPYTVTSNFVAENGFENKVAFLLHERQWAVALVPDVCLNIRSQWYSYKAGFKVLLWCNSCVQCQERGGWKGYPTYNLTTKKG